MQFFFPLTLGPSTEEGSRHSLSMFATASQVSRFISCEKASEIHREKVPWFGDDVLGVGQCLLVGIQ